MSERLKGQVAIITGASRGLGQFCALGFANEGARVVIAARTEKEKDKRLPGTIYHTAEMINKAGANSGDTPIPGTDYLIHRKSGTVID
jgi:citronellol/citronellal dehydrogenase